MLCHLFFFNDVMQLLNMGKCLGRVDRGLLMFSDQGKWLYGCKGLLDVTCFRRAAARLLARHEGLRAEMESPAGRGLALLGLGWV